MMGRSTRNIVTIQKNKKNSEITAVIIADKPAHRMKSFGTLLLYQINFNKILLDYQIKALKNYLTIKEIILIIGFESNKILKKIPNGFVIIKNNDYEQNNTLASISIGVNASTTNNILFIDGNTLISGKVFNKFEPIFSQIFVNNKLTKTDSGTEIVSSIVNTKNEIESSSFSNTLNNWYNIIFITGKELQLLRTFCNDDDKQKWYALEATNKITDMGGKFIAYYPEHTIININSQESLNQAEKYASRNS